MLLLKFVLVLLKNLIEFIYEVSLFMAHIVFDCMKLTLDLASLHNFLSVEIQHVPIGTLDIHFYSATKNIFYWNNIFENLL